MKSSSLLLTLCLASGWVACGVEYDPLDDLDIPTWEEYRASAEGVLEGRTTYVVEGDILVPTLEELADRYQRMVEAAEAEALGIGRTHQGLTMHTHDGGQSRWPDAMKRHLWYCVDRASFGSYYDRIVAEMDRATRAWEAGVDVNFVHIRSRDGNCSRTGGIVFPVRMVTGAVAEVANVRGGMAFFPHYDEAKWTLWLNVPEIDRGTHFPVENTEGILRHELGHILGFRHEHLRVAQTKSSCSGESDGHERQDLTPHDSHSVMNYGFCAGAVDRNPEISVLDIEGAASVYGGFERVSFRTENKHFLQAQHGGGGDVNAHPWHSDTHETFFMRRVGSQINLVTFKGYYVQAHANGYLKADSTFDHSRTRFTIVPQSDGRVALRTYANRYVVAENAGGTGANANRTGIGAWEKFDMVELDKTVGRRFMATSHCTTNPLGTICRFISSKSGGSVGVSFSVGNGGDQTFGLIDLGRGDVALRTPDGYYMATEGIGSWDLVAKSRRLGAEAKWQLVSLPGGYTALRSHYLRYLKFKPNGDFIVDAAAIGPWEIFKMY